MQTNDDENLLTQEHLNTIARFMLGGGLIGLGAGGAASLVQYLKRLNKDRTANDDDTLYVYRDKDQLNKAASNAYDSPIDATGEAAGNVAAMLIEKLYHGAKGIGKGLTEGASEALSDAKNVITDPAAAGLSMAAAVTSGLGGYALARKLYAAYDRAKAQEELDKSQMAFLDAQGYKKASVAAPDNAGKPFNPTNMDFAGGLSVALPLLVMLTAGATTKTYLDAQYPIAKQRPKAPRHIEIIDKPDNDTEEYDEPMPGYDKQASAGEFLLHVIESSGADNSDVRNMIHAVADQGVLELKKAAATMGVFDAMNMAKGASAIEVSPAAKHMAITYLAKSARLSTPMFTAAAAEFAELYPSLYKTACTLDEATTNDLVGIAACLGEAVRAQGAFEAGLIPDNLEKGASTLLPEVGDMMGKWLNANAVKNNRPATKGDEDESTGTSGEEAGIDDPDSPSRPHSTKQLLMKSQTGRKHLDSSKTDVIDKILDPYDSKEEEPDDQKSSGPAGNGFISPTI